MGFAAVWLAFQFSCKLHAQTQPEHDSVFRSGTFFGKSFPEVRDAKIFGLPSQKLASRGRFNVPHRLEFHDQFQTDNPYSTEIGFDDKKEAAYFFIRKRSLEQGTRLKDGEIIPMLVKLARGGEWKLLTKQEEDDHLYEYSHVYKRFEGDKVVQSEVFRAYAFVPNHRQFVFAYTPFVSPNLTELNAGRSFLFASGIQMELVPGDGMGEASVSYIDAPAPPELVAFAVSKDPGERQLALDALNKSVADLEKSGSDSYLIFGSEVQALKEALSIASGKPVGDGPEGLKSPAFQMLSIGEGASDEKFKEQANLLLQSFRGVDLTK